MIGKNGGRFSRHWKVALALLLLPSAAQAGIITGPFAGWTTLTNLPEARSYPAAALVGNQLYAIGGVDNSTNTRDTVWMLDVANPESGWTAVSNLPAGRDNMGAAVLGTEIYVIGGSDGTNNLSTVYVYDTTNAAGGWTSISNLPTAIVGISAASANGKVYTAGGWTTGPRAYVYEYDPATPAAGWLSISNLPDVAAGTAMVEFEGLLYVAGGRDSVVSQSTNVYVYNPTNPAGAWQVLRGLPAGRRRHGMGVANGRIIVMGGEAVGGGATRTAYSFNPARPADGWATLSSMSVCGEAMAGASDGERVFGVGGEFGGATQDGVCVGSYETGVTPGASPFAGGVQVTIRGVDLGDGSDITNVTLCGVEAAIGGQSATQVIVTAGQAIAWGTGHVSVVSTSQGESLRENAFGYRPPGWIGGSLTDWQAVQMAPPLRYLAAVAVTGAAWIIGGRDNSAVPQSNVWEYGRTGGFSWWWDRTPIPTGRSDHAAVTVGKRVYVLGGYYYGICADSWVFDTDNPGAGWQVLSNLPAPRMALGAAAVDGKIYAVGGSGGSVQKTVWRYDTENPSGGWTSVSNLPGGRYRHGVAALNGHIYAVGGSGSSGVTNTAWEYNPLAPEAGWTSISNLPAARQDLGLVAHMGRLFAMGGSDGFVPKSNTYCYDPTQPEAGWKQTVALPQAIVGLGVATLQSNLFVAGGEYYDIGLGAWVGSETVMVGRILSGVSPTFGTAAGGTEVTIIGGGLGSGSDITNVTLCGVSASIISQSATQVVVQTGVAPSRGTGDVVVCSETIGATVASNAYTYVYPLFGVRDYTANALANNEAASAAHKTDFQGVLVNHGQACLLELRNTGTVELAISGVTTNGTGAGAFLVNNCPTSIAAGGTANVTVDYTPTALAVFTASVTFVTTATNSPFVVNFSGFGMDISSGSGPAAGGNTLTVYGGALGDGSDITNVTLCGESMAIVSQTATSVTVEVTGGVGTCDIVVESTSQGTTTLMAGYRYNGQGYVIGALNAWIAVSNMPQPLHHHAAASFGSKILVYGGYEANDAYPTNRVYEYDTLYPENGWTEVSNMPAKRANFAGAEAGGKICCAGGTDGSIQRSQTYLYDPLVPEAAWTQGSNAPVASTGCRGVGVLGKFYSVGGYIAAGELPNCYAYDPANPAAGWVTMPAMPVPLQVFGATSLDGLLYVGGGRNSENPLYMDGCYVFDPGNPGAGWTTLSNLPSARCEHTAASAYGRVYQIGGYAADAGRSPRVYEYYPGTPEQGWVRSKNLPDGRYQSSAATVSNVIYVTGGRLSDASYTREVLRSEFDPGIVPQYGPLAGGISVTLSGVNLGDGSDITNVTLAGVQVTSIDSQCGTQVVVTATGVPAPTSGLVVVYSESYGISHSAYPFYYEFPVIAVLGTNRAVIENGEAASYDKGTHFGASIAGAYLNRTLYITNCGNTTLPITGVTTTGADAASFTVQTALASVDVATRSNWVVRFTPAGVGVHTAVVHIASSATNSPYLVNLRGVGCALSTNIGPSLGGNTITIEGAEFGDGFDITNVTVCGVAASIVSQSTTQLVVTLGGPHAGSGDVLIYSTSAGMIRIASAYTYNTAGYIWDQAELTGWKAVSNLPADTYNLAAAAAGGRVYAIGGQTTGITADVYAYDPAAPANGWAAVSNLPVPRRLLAAEAVGGKVYAIGGNDGSAVDTVYAYDPAQPQTGWASVSNLPAPTYNLAAGVAGDYLYTIGGRDAALTDAVYRYDVTLPAAGWTGTSNLPAALDRHAAASLDGTIYVMGGDDGTTIKNVRVMDGSSPTGWTEIAQLPTARRVAAAAVAHGKVFLIGGRNSLGTVVDTVYAYDPQSPGEGWKTVAPLPYLRGNLAAAAVGDCIYAIGGQNSGGSAVASVYESTFSFGVLPNTGHTAGGNVVTITGIDLGDGGDITNVYLCGVPVAGILGQSTTQVVVTAGSSGVSQTGDVVVCSVSFGETTKSNAYIYGEVYDIVYIARDGAHSSPYNSWALAATNFAGALAVAIDGTLVLVSNGEYRLTGTIAISNAVSVRSMNGAADTIVDGNYPAFTNRCFLLTHTGACLEGLTIRNGYVASGQGGGVRIEDAGTVRDCLVISNHAGTGGGIYALDGGLVANCRIEGNTVNNDGAGLYLRNSGGWAMNCLITGNSAGRYGGGAYIYAGDQIRNSTICDNTATSAGDGTAVEGMGTLENCIIYYNGVQNGTGIGGGPGATYDHCCITPNPIGGISVVTNTPQFINRPGGNYRLGYGSPCINSGKNLSASVTNDLDGFARPVGGLYDIGAYEYDGGVYDTDGEGLCDDDEVGIFGTDPTIPDTDGDDFTDYQEIIADTRPTDSNDFFRVTGMAHDSPVTVYFDSSTGRVYTMQGGADLPDGTWSSVPGAGPRMGIGGADSMQDTNEPPQGPFYRMGVELP